MIAIEKNITSLALLATVGLVAGCSAEATSTSTTSGREARDPTAEMSAAGLTLTEASADHVAGHLERDGAALAFHFTYDGDRHHALVTRLSGEPIFESTLVDGYDTTVYFGGRATARGRVGGEIEEKTGDDAVFDELASSPEAKLVPQLKEALIAAGVDQDLIRLRPATTAGSVVPQDLSNGWHILQPGQSMGFWSWSFWGTTTVALESYTDYWNGFYSASFTAGPNAPEYVSGNGHANYYRMWWGAYVSVKNTRMQICQVEPPYACSEGRMWAIAY